MDFQSKIKSYLPWSVLYIYRKARSLPEDLPYIFQFIFRKTKIPVSFFKKVHLIFKFYRISYLVDCPHMENEMIQVALEIFNTSHEMPGIILEAGSYKGGSGAKISLISKIAKRKLFIFDSFEGLPENQEEHKKNIYGGDANFPGGSYAGSLEEVKSNIKKYGCIDACEFVKGWFENTMPELTEKIAVAYVDVDLVSSTKTCLKYLYPLLNQGGVLFSQDGHLPLIIELLEDDDFWNKEVSVDKPKIKGLGKIKLVKINK